MKLGPAPKTYMVDGHRTVPPMITLERVEPLCDEVGVTQITDITDLDRIGIPVFSILRPTAGMGTVPLYKGKGASKEQAKVSAIMETLERFSAEPDHATLERDFIESKLATGDAVDPRELILPQRTAFHIMHQPVAWTRGYDLLQEEEVWVPASAVFHPYSSNLDMPLFRTNSNGLASGNVLEEAVLHALCEVIERDAWSICEFRRSTRADIDVPEDNGLLSDLLRRFECNGINIWLKDLTSEVGIPTIGASCDDIETKDPNMLTMGIGTHLNPEVAAIRALTEVAQSRATFLHMEQENPDVGKPNRQIGYRRVKSLNKMWFMDSGERRGIDAFPHLDTPDIFDDIQVVLDELSRREFRRVVAVDLTDPRLDIPVVRIVVRGMEVYAVDDERVGPRLMGTGGGGHGI